MAITPLDIDTQSALAQVGATTETFEQYTSIRALAGSADSSFSYGVHASRPSSATQGDRYFETDRFWLYYYTGTAWKFLAGINSGTNATRGGITVNANDNGATFYATDTQVWWRVISGAWTTLPVTGSAPDLTIVTKSANYTLTDADDVVECDTSGGGFTITLHSAATAKKKVYYIIKIDAANTLTIAPPSGTISGSASLTPTAQWTVYSLFPNGTNWRIV